MYISISVDEENFDWLLEKLESPNQDPVRDEWFDAVIDSAKKQVIAQMKLKRDYNA